MFPYYLTAYNESLVSKLYPELEKYKDNFKDSTIYLPKTSQEKTIPEKRYSQTATFNDSKIRHIVQDEVISLLQSDQFYFVVPNYHQDWLRYGLGGKFKTHRDFVKYHYKDMVTYTLLIGLKKTEVGGETNVFIPYKKKRHKSGRFKNRQRKMKTISFSETVIPGGILCFQADLLHSGTSVIKGEKEVLLLTLWAFKKNFKKDKKMIQIKSSDNHIFLLPRDLLKDTIFDSQSSFENQDIIETTLCGSEVSNSVNFLTGNYSKINLSSNLFDVLGYTGVLCVDYPIYQEIEKIIFSLKNNNNVYMTDTFSSEFYHVVKLLDFIPFQVIIKNRFQEIYESNSYNDNDFTSSFIEIYLFNGIHWKTYNVYNNHFYQIHDINDPALRTHNLDLDIEQIMINKIMYGFGSSSKNSIIKYKKQDGSNYNLSCPIGLKRRFKVDLDIINKSGNIIINSIIDYCLNNKLNTKTQFSRNITYGGISYEMCNSIELGMEEVYEPEEYLLIHQSLYYGGILIK